MREEGGRRGWRLRARLAALVLALAVVGALVVVGTVLINDRQQSSENQLATQLRPAQTEVVTLTGLLEREQDGAWRFWVTGDTAVSGSYWSSRRQAARIEGALRTDLTGQPAALADLTRLRKVQTTWDRGLAPELSRQPGSASTSLPAGVVLTGMQLFDATLGRVDDLGREVGSLVSDELQAVSTDQQADRWLLVAAAVAVLGLAGVTFLVFRRSVAKPLEKLSGQVQAVAGGDLGRRVEPGGPPELASLGQAVDSVRHRLANEAELRDVVEERLWLLQEDEVTARILNDTVIQRLFGTGLLLQSIERRHPEIAESLAAANAEIDAAIRELRTLLFGFSSHRRDASLTARVLELVQSIEGTVHLSHRVEFHGPLDAEVGPDLADHTVTVLRELLSNVASHPDATTVAVDVGLDANVLTLTVEDDAASSAPPRRDAGAVPLGPLTGPLATVAERAARVGATCTVGRSTLGGTAVVWSVRLHGPPEGSDPSGPREPSGSAAVGGRSE